LVASRKIAIVVAAAVIQLQKQTDESTVIIRQLTAGKVNKALSA